MEKLKTDKPTDQTGVASQTLHTTVVTGSYRLSFIFRLRLNGPQGRFFAMVPTKICATMRLCLLIDISLAVAWCLLVQKVAWLNIFSPGNEDLQSCQ